MSPSGHAERFELLLDYFPNADHAGIYAAQAGGHFRDVGLDVAIRQPSDPAAPLRRWRPDGSTWPSRTSPRCCARATRACAS